MSAKHTDSSLATVILAALGFVGYGIYLGYRTYDSAYGRHQQPMQVAVKGWQVGEIRNCWLDLGVVACADDWDASDVKTFNVRFDGDVSKVLRPLWEPKAICT